MRSQRWRTPVNRCLVVLLVLAFPLPGSLVMAGREAGATAGILSVKSEPAGATVYVDGRQRGQTPLDLEGLPEGDHRVNLVKDGYLENSRVLSLRSDRAEAVSVTLTPSGERPNAVEVQIRSGGGGGGSIWTNPLFLGAVAAGGGTAAYLALRDTNKAPLPGGVVVSAADGAAVGIASLTSFNFSANGASDPDGALVHNSIEG